MPPASAVLASRPDTRRAELPMAGREMALRSFKRADQAAAGAARDDSDDAPLATATLIFSAGAAVRRFDWLRERPYNEVLVVEEGAVRMERLSRGAPLLNTHDSWALESVLGVVRNPRITAGMGECDVTFSRRESIAGHVQDVADGIVRNVSVGYVRHAVQMVPPETEAGVWTYRVVDWEPHEVSLVPIPADMDAQVRSSIDGKAPPGAAVALQRRTYPCEFSELPLQPRAAAHTTKATTMNEAELQAQRDLEAARVVAEQAATAAAATAAITAAANVATAATAQRSADITDLCVRHQVPQLAGKLIREGKTVDQARATVLEEIAVRDAAAGGHRNIQIQAVGDEFDTRLAGMQEALLCRVDAKAKLTDLGRQFRGMSLMEMGRDWLEARGVRTRSMERMQLATQILQFRSPGMLGTSDFGSLLGALANKRLRNGYDENQPSYRVWARRAPNAPDFKAMNVIQLGAAPDLLQVNEHGEFKYGSMTDGKETYSMLTSGRIVSLTRQSIINDDLRGFDRLIGAFGNSAARLENRTIYAILTANANLADGGALFNATAVTTAGGHANLLTGAPSALQASSLATARTSIRKQKGLQSEELNVAPAYLIVPADLEQTAYQLTSPDFVAATAGNINEFRRGGRTALEPVVESILSASSATAWYLTAQNGQIDTVEYCYLDGAEGPVIESEMGFEVDGISYKCRLDFAAKAIDFRGMLKSAGA